MNYSEKISHRILHLTFSEDCLDYSLRDLVSEYIRRMAIICKPLGIRRRHPFFDVAEIINPEIRANFKDLEKLNTHFKKMNHPILHNVWTPRICEWSLHFASLQDSCSPILELQSPYEPLIVLYERHGSFIVKHEILIDGGSMPIADWWNRDDPNPIVDLGD